MSDAFQIQLQIAQKYLIGNIKESFKKASACVWQGKKLKGSCKTRELVIRYVKKSNEPREVQIQELSCCPKGKRNSWI